MFNETYLYDTDVLDSFTNLIFRLRRLTTTNIDGDDDIKWAVSECEKTIKVLYEIEKSLNIKYIEPVNPSWIPTQKEYEDKKIEPIKSKS